MAAGSRQPLITMIYGSWFQTATYNYGLWQLVPDSHSKLWAMAAGSRQPLITMVYGSWFQTATYNYDLWQLVPDSHLWLWAVAAGSWQPLKTMGCGSWFQSDIVQAKSLKPSVYMYIGHSKTQILCTLMTWNIVLYVWSLTLGRGWAKNFRRTFLQFVWSSAFFSDLAHL